MTTNINFPNYLTVGDIKDFIADLPSDALVEFFYVETCGCCIGREVAGKDNIELYLEYSPKVEIQKGRTSLRVPVLKLGHKFCESLTS